MKFKEILYNELEGNELSESGKRLLGLKEIGWSNGKIICKNGEHMVHLDRETDEVLKVYEKVEPDLNQYKGNGFHRPGLCECPSESDHQRDKQVYSKYARDRLD